MIPVLGVVIEKVFHEASVVANFPIDPVSGRVGKGYIGRRLQVLDASWAVLDHTEEKHVMGCATRFTLDLKLVVIPAVGPLLGVIVDVPEEKVMK